MTGRLLALLGGSPLFSEVLHVGRPAVGSRRVLLERIEGMLDRRWFSNDGPLVREFEQAIAEYVGVRNCVAMCNATVALEAVGRALRLEGEVIVPAYTFVASAHAFSWQGLVPVLADIDDRSHNIDPEQIESLVTPRTSAILAVHLWGRPCAMAQIEGVAKRHGLAVIYDAAHAFACSSGGRMIGGNGSCEVFSFHATKFLNSFEGGAVVTNDDELASRLRRIRNFGFARWDDVVELGTNGKMTEVCAAMGLTSLESIDELIAANKRNWNAYRLALADLPGVSVLEYPTDERCNFQYVVVEIDSGKAALNRDEVMAVLHAENVLARRYFWPGVHRMAPYSEAGSVRRVSNTEAVAGKVLVLPTGQAVDPGVAARISELIRTALDQPGAIRARLGGRVLPGCPA